MSTKVTCACGKCADKLEEDCNTGKRLKAFLKYLEDTVTAEQLMSVDYHKTIDLIKEKIKETEQKETVYIEV